MTRGKMNDSDVNLRPVIELLKDVKVEVRHTKNVVDGINRELGGVQATLRAMEERNIVQDKKIERIRTEQMSCQARNRFDSIAARVRKLDESSQHDVTGSMPVIHGGFSALSSESEATVKKAFMRMLPFIITAFIVGVGVVSIFFFKAFGMGDGGKGTSGSGYTAPDDKKD